MRDDRQLAAKGAAQHVFGQHLRRRALRHQPVATDGAVDADHVRVMIDHAAQIVGTDHDADAAVGDVAERIQELIVGNHVQGGGWFVQEEQTRFAGQGAGDQDALALSAGELADLAICQIGHVHPFQCPVDRIAANLAGADAAAPAEAVAAHLHHFAHCDREAPVDIVDLRHVAQRAAHVVRALSVDLHPSALRTQQAGDGLEQRALAGAVAADDGGERARRQGEIELFEDRRSAVADGQPFAAHFRADDGCCRGDNHAIRVLGALVGSQPWPLRSMPLRPKSRWTGPRVGLFQWYRRSLSWSARCGWSRA